MGRGSGDDCGEGKKSHVQYLSSRVDNLCCKLLVLIANHLAKSIFNGGIVAVDKVAVDELHRQTRLACSCLSVVLVRVALHVKLARRDAQQGSRLTDGPTADNGHLSLLRGRHLAAGFLRRSSGS